MKNRSELPIKTLHLSDRDKAKLLWAIDQANQNEDKENQRRLRVTCTNNEAVLTLKHNDCTETRLSVLARNLSRWGAALVHGRYVHPDARCELMIQSSNGRWQRMLGRVRHIRHIQGTIHELGVAFDEPIELGDFVSLSPGDETRYLQELADDMPEADETEVVELSSRALVVNDFTSDRKLMSHWLTQAGLSVISSNDARDALVQIQEHVFDLLLVDCELETTSGEDLIRALRMSDYAGPIIAVSADESETTKSKMMDAGADRFMTKPFTAETLAKEACELIGINKAGDTEPIFSTHKDDVGMRPLLTEFTRGLARTIDELRNANAQANHETLEYISQQLKGVGSGYGFPAITDKAGQVLGLLNDDADDADDIQELEAIRKTTGELIAILNRVKLS